MPQQVADIFAYDKEMPGSSALDESSQEEIEEDYEVDNIIDVIFDDDQEAEESYWKLYIFRTFLLSVSFFGETLSAVAQEIFELLKDSSTIFGVFVWCRGWLKGIA